MLEKIEAWLKSNKKLAFGLIFLFSFAIISFGINQTGETWDEIAYYNGGRQYISNLAHLNFKSTAWNANKEHPPVAKYVYGAASVFGYKAGGEHFTGGRIASAAMLSLAIALTFYFAGILFSFSAGLMAALILALSPPFVAYGRVLGMDSIGTLLFLTVAIGCYNFACSRASWRNYLVLIIILGIGYATRYNIVIATLFLPLAVALFAKWRGNIWRWISLIVIPIGALVVLYLLWPFLWTQPIAGIQASVGHWGQVKEWYLGVKNAALPNSYFLSYFFFTTPVVVLALALAGALTKTKIENKIYLAALLILPFLNSFLGIKQGGIRYLLFAWIPLSIFAAIGFVGLLRISKKFWLQAVFVFLLVGYGIFNMATHYPYYLDYYNEFLAGSKGNYQKKLLQFGWWGEGGKRACEWINRNAEEKASVWNNMKPDHTLDNLRGDIRLVRENENPDFIVINTNWLWQSDFKAPSGYKLIHEEKSGGAPILSIFKKI